MRLLLVQSQTGDEAYNDNGLVPRAIRLLKDKYPDIVSIFIVHYCYAFLWFPLKFSACVRLFTLMLPWIPIPRMGMMES